MKRWTLTACFALSICACAAAQQPVVAIHVSEVTQGLESTVAASPTPTGTGTTGYQWWTPWWHYFVMPQAVEDALSSDGTPFVVVTDADITAGNLLTATGAPKYPIVISLASEAIRDDEVTPLLNYVAAGGFLFVGSSSFTRNPDGSSRGDFAIANAMGVHMANATLQNWTQDSTLTNVVNSRLTSHIPSGTLTWRMPLGSEDIPWGISGNHSEESSHYVWQVTANGATVIANGDNNLPYLTATAYQRGQIIYDAAMQPLMGYGGFAPNVYAYGIFRNAIQWAFESSGLPIIKLSPWPYPYNSAYMVRHDFEDSQSDINSIESSAQSESIVGATGDYYFCTGTLRVEMGNSASTVASLQRAASLYGATIGSHNGGLKNPNNPSLVISDYDYWHWGPDEALDVTPPGYSSGAAYASSSIAQSFSDIDGWLTGYESNRRTWVAPYFNGTREASNQLLDQLGTATAGEQMIGPFPHWTISTQTAGKHFGFLSIPTSGWYIGTDVAQSLENGYSPSTINALIDYYYGLGALVNLYGHEPSTNDNPYEYIHYAAAKPAMWPVNASKLAAWWKTRSGVQLATSYSTASNRLVVTTNVTGATDPNTAIELVIPNWAVASGGIQVQLNGADADPSSYRVYNQGIKVNVGTTVSTVVVSYPLTAGPVAQNDSYTVASGSTLSPATPGVLTNDTDPTPNTTLTAQLWSLPSHGSLTFHADGSFVYVPQSGYSGTDLFSYIATDGQDQSGVATVTITVTAAGSALFVDNFSGIGADPQWVTVMGTWSQANSALNGTSMEDNSAVAYAANGNFSDFSVQATIQLGTLGFGGGIDGRVNIKTGAHYGIWIYPETMGLGPSVRVYKFTDWTTSGSAIAQASLPSVGTAKHVIFATFQGNTIQVSVDGVPYINVTDNGYTSGTIGLDMYTSSQLWVMSASNVSVQAVAGAPPVAQNDSYTMQPGTTLNVAAPGVLANDSAGSGGTMTAVLVSSTTHGNLSLQSDGSFSYTPMSGFTGTDSFTYQVDAGGVQSNTASVSINVIASTTSAGNDSYSTLAGGVLTVAAPGLLANDSNSIGGTLTAVLVSPPANGSLSLNPDGSFTYTPAGTFSGTDVFTYQAVAGGVSSNTATVSIVVTGQPSLVVFSDKFTGTGTDPNWSTVMGSWTTNNGVMQGSSGTGSYGYAYTGNWTDYSVQAQIQFPTGAYGGGIGGRVNPATGAHYGVWVYPEGSAGGSAIVRLLKFTDWTTWSAIGQATLPGVGIAWHTLSATFQGGSIQVWFDGTEYINVTDTSAYLSGAVSLDMWTNTTPYVLSFQNLVVQGLSSAPIAQNDSYSVQSGSTLTVSAPGVLANDSNPGGGSLTAVLVSQPAHGSLTLNPDGSFSYTPAAGYSGSDSFTYQASSGGATSNVATVTITVTAGSSVSSVSLKPAAVTGGVSSTGTVTLSAAAPSGGAVVLLSSDNPTVAAPTQASVTVPGGATSTTFTVATTPVATQTIVNISASLNGTTKSAKLTVNAATLQSLSLSPTSVRGSISSKGTVTLTGAAPATGAVIALSSANPAVAAPTQASVTVPPGATSATFSVSTTPVSAQTIVSISATFNAITRSANLTVNPPLLSALSLSPTAVIGGNTSIGTVTLGTPAPAAGAVVALSSSNPGVAAPSQSSVVVSGGMTTATFTVGTSPVLSNTSVTISGTYSGTTKKASLTVQAPTLSGFVVNPQTVVGGSSATGTITLTGAAAPGGETVAITLSSTKAGVSAPSSVTVPGGATTANFPISTKPVPSNRTITITATDGNKIQVAFTVTT